jgi:3-hydroxybutyryl-CoA dehydratase
MPKPFDYEAIQIGEVLGRRDVTITQAMIDTCAEAIESDHPWYCGDSPYGVPVAPPTIFDNDSLRMLDEQYDRFGSIHARQSWEFHRPARLGERVALRVSIVDKYVRRERPYLVMEMTAVNEADELLCRSLHTSLMSLRRGE